MDLSAVPCLNNDGGFLVKFLGLFMLDHVDSQDADFEAEVHWKWCIGNAERVHCIHGLSISVQLQVKRQYGRGAKAKSDTCC